MQTLDLNNCKVCGKQVDLALANDTELNSNIYTINCKCGNFLKTKQKSQWFFYCPDEAIIHWNKQNQKRNN